MKDTEEEARESQCYRISKDSGPREGFEELVGEFRHFRNFLESPTVLPRGASHGQTSREM